MIGEINLQIVTWAKVAWAAIALLAVIINIWTLREAWIDLRYVVAQTAQRANHIRAWQSLRDEIVTFIFQLALFMIRACWVFWPNPATEAFARRWLLDATLITVLQIFIAVNCVWDLRDRRETIRNLPHDRELQ